MLYTDFLQKAISCRTEILFHNIDELINSGSLKSIHDSRVSARRLGAILEGIAFSDSRFNFKTLCEDLKTLISLLGKAREISVCIKITNEYLSFIQIQSCYINNFARYLIKIFKKEKEILLSHYEVILFPEKKTEFMNFFKFFSLIQEEPVLNQKNSLNSLFRSISSIYLDKVQSIKDITSSSERFKELHQIRIKAKSLRYLIELLNETEEQEFSHEFNTVKSFVDMSGMVHDYNVLISYLNKFLKSNKGNYLSPASADNSLKSFKKYLKYKETALFKESADAMNIFFKDEFRLGLLQKIYFAKFH